MPDRAKDLDRLEQAMNEVAGGIRVPCLGPGVTALSGGAAPISPRALSAMIEAEVRVPRRASGKLWEAAQYVESRTFRAPLDHLALKAFDTPAAQANPVHDWLARVASPMVVDSWHDDYLLKTFGDRDWGLSLGVSRNGTWVEVIFFAPTTGQEPRLPPPTGPGRHLSASRMGWRRWATAISCPTATTSRC